MTLSSAALLGFLILGFTTQPTARADASRKTKSRQLTGDAAFQTRIKPVLGKYCFGCHGEKKKGELELRVYTDEASVLRDRKTFAKVVKNLQAHEKPPEKKPQPTPEERELIAAWIQSEIFKCDCDHPDPGRVTIRRLNRAEYNNTIRDLVGVDFQPADDFPADDSGYGFDNIGDVLSLPPVLLEKYLAAARKILHKAIVTDLKAKPLQHFDADALDGTAPGESLGGGIKRLGREGNIFVAVNFPHDGEYILRAKAYGEQAGPEPARMSFSLDDKELKRFDVKAEEPAPEIYETRLQVTAGDSLRAGVSIGVDGGGELAVVVCGFVFFVFFPIGRGGGAWAAAPPRGAPSVRLPARRRPHVFPLPRPLQRAARQGVGRGQG